MCTETLAANGVRSCNVEADVVPGTDGSGPSAKLVPARSGHGSTIYFTNNFVT
jgi:hypothetical protein